MVTGIGIDLCRVERMKKAIQSEHFKERIFSPEEISYCESKGKRCFESYAAGFAAREAFCKASGKNLGAVMFGGNFTLTRNNEGVPAVKLSGNLAMPGAKIFVSLTHEGEYACAVVVIDKEGE